MRTELQIKANKKMIIIGIIALGTALLTAVIKVELDVTPRIIIVSLIAIVGIPCCAIGLFYRIRINDNGIEEKCLFYKKRVELNESVRISETIHYSNYEVGSRYVYIANNICTVTLRPWLVDTPSIAKKLNEMGLLIVKYNPKVECGSNCKLPDVEIEALSYRLIVGSRGINRAFWIIILLSLLTLFIDFEIGSWILMAIATYWYYLIFEYHDLFFARGNLIVGSEDTVSNIWKKLDIKLDIKLVIKIIVLTMVLWCVLFYFYHTTEVLIDNNHYTIYICLLIAFGMIRMCAVEKNIIIWVIVTLIISATVVVYSFYIEWNMSYSSVETDVETLLVNEKKVNRFTFEDKEYTVPYLSIMKEGDNKTDIIVHKSILGNLYARTRL